MLPEDFSTTPEGRSFMSRRVIIIDESGHVTTHPLSIVFIEGGRLEVTPFQREIAGVEYTDKVITCQRVDGRWKITFND